MAAFDSQDSMTQCDPSSGEDGRGAGTVIIPPPTRSRSAMATGPSHARMAKLSMAPPGFPDRPHAGARILLVDDEPAFHSIMDRIFAANGLKGSYASRGTQALDMILNDPPDLVVVDIMMSGMNGLELCRQIKSNPDTMLLPVLLLTSLDSTQDKVKGFNAGADEYLTKPFQNVEIIARIRSMLRFKFLRDQLENAEQVIFTLARAVEAKDAYTAGHIERVSTLAVAIGDLLGFDRTTCNQLHRGGILHDIGKIGVPDSVLNKPGRLTPAEFEQIKKHPHVGEQICRGLKTLQPVLDLIRHHHERLDGSGYPDGLSGNEISVPARIMAVCDVFDALTSSRSYRQAMNGKQAIAIIDDGVQAGYWDNEVVRCLKELEHTWQPAAADETAECEADIERRNHD